MRPPLVLELRGGGAMLRVAARTPPRLARAERICPTHQDYPCEVVLVDEQEALLIRPGALASHFGQLRSERM